MYDQNSHYGAILEVDVEYLILERIKHKDLHFLPEKRKINKVHQLVTIADDKEKYVVHISALKQALNHGLKPKKVHRVITFKQKAWLKPNFMTSKCFSKDLIAIEMRKTKVMINKPLYLGQAILDISKTLMYEFYYDYIKPKYGDKVKLCYMDTDSFILHIQTEDFYMDIDNDVNEWFDTSGYDKKLNRPLTTGINKKVTGKFKDDLNGLIVTELCAPRAKTYSIKYYDENDKIKEMKKEKGTKKWVINNDIKFDD